MKRRVSSVWLFCICCLLLCACGKHTDNTQNLANPDTSENAALNPATAGETAPSPDPYQGVLRISEIATKNTAMLKAEDGSFRDWIELENCSDTAVDLSGWSVTDKPAKHRQFLPELSLEPGVRQLVFCSEFGLKEGETLLLADPAGKFQDSVVCGAVSSESCTLIRREDGSLTETKWMSPGFPNGKEGYLSWCAADGRDSALQINEVMVSNEHHPDLNLQLTDWVELRNVSDSVLDLSLYSLQTGKDRQMTWRLPELSLEPGGMLCVSCSEDTPASESNTGFSLNAVEERLYLCHDTEGTADYVLLHDIPIEGSMGRLAGENGFFYFTEPTYGEENRDGKRMISDMPVSVTEEGPVDGVDRLPVELSAPGKIYYTLDGSVPTELSMPYTGPIEITETTVIRAFAVEADAVPSRVSTFSYFLNEYHTLPILSLAVDDAYQFELIYTFGQKWMPVPANLALYDHGTRFNQACEMSLKGWTSLSMPKKSIGVEFKGRYGGMLYCDVFGNGISEYDGLVMRVGQDFNFSVFRNELMQELCREASDCLYTQDSKYCVLYVNGEYYGIYCLKDDITRQFYANHAGVSVESVEGFRAPAPIDTEYYSLMVDVGWHSDLSDPANYRRLCEGINMDSLIDWFLFEAYCGNSDTAGNQRVYRSAENGSRWEYVLYDLDWAFHYWEGGFRTILDGIGNVGPDMLNMLNNLLDSEQFRDRLLTRYAELADTVFADDYVLNKIDDYVTLLQPEIARDHERWNLTEQKWLDCVELLRSTIRDHDYVNYTIRDLCKRLNLTDEERVHYFGTRALPTA